MSEQKMKCYVKLLDQIEDSIEKGLIKALQIITSIWIIGQFWNFFY